MIKEFKNNNTTRESGVIYAANLEQIKGLYDTDPALAGELAISIIELTLTGAISSDNVIISLMLKNLEKTTAKDRERYEKRVTNSELKKLERLKKIAELYNNGMKQKDIAAELGKAPSTISEDLATIRVDYPELLSKKFGKFEKFGGVTDTDTVTDTVTDTDTDTESSSELAFENVDYPAYEKIEIWKSLV